MDKWWDVHQLSSLLTHLFKVTLIFVHLQVEPIRNFFAALFLASIGMLIHVHFLWNHVDILLAAVILVIIVKTLVVAVVVKGFGYSNKTALLVRVQWTHKKCFLLEILSNKWPILLIGWDVLGTNWGVCVCSFESCFKPSFSWGQCHNTF